MDLLLTVQFNEKDSAKANGAWWKPNIKSWYVREDEKADYHQKWNQYFEKWLPKHNLLCKNIYLFQMERKCWKCGKTTSVICLGTNDAYTLFDGNISYDRYKNLQLLAYVENMPENLEKFLKEKYLFYPSYSSAIKKAYYCNHCTHCGGIQGDNFLHEVPKEAFFKKLCYKNSSAAEYSKIANEYMVPIFAQLPYYDDVCNSSQMILMHMETEIENRASLHVTQKLIDTLFNCSNDLGKFVIDGV